MIKLRYFYCRAKPPFLVVLLCQHLAGRDEVQDQTIGCPSPSEDPVLTKRQDAEVQKASSGGMVFLNVKNIHPGLLVPIMAGWSNLLHNRVEYASPVL